MNKKKAKYLLGLVLVCALGFFVSMSLVAHADNGSLVVDDSQITQNSQSADSNKSIGYQEAPYLFLQGTQSSQASIDSKNKQVLSEAQQQSFAKAKSAASALDLTSINQQLFPKTYVATPISGDVPLTQAASKLPQWLFFVIVGVIMVLAAALGILLGRRFSKVFIKKERGSKYE
jgi:hypothetical protein